MVHRNAQTGSHEGADRAKRESFLREYGEEAGTRNGDGLTRSAVTTRTRNPKGRQPRPLGAKYSVFQASSVGELVIGALPLLRWRRRMGRGGHFVIYALDLWVFQTLSKNLLAHRSKSTS